MAIAIKQNDSTKIASKRLERTLDHHQKYFSDWKSSRFNKTIKMTSETENKSK